jgi:hypothetical protein
MIGQEIKRRADRYQKEGEQKVSTTEKRGFEQTRFEKCGSRGKKKKNTHRSNPTD